MVLQEVSYLLREYVFDQLPIRLLKVPEMELMDRRDTFQFLLPKLSHITEEYLAEKQQENTYPKDRRDLILGCIGDQAPYAILSHTWFEDEVTFADWNAKRNLQGPGYEKLERFCAVAARDFGVSLAWMDTICINKESTSELDESIRSMYRWYEFSSICMIFLAETTSLEDMPRDRWFTRGWTLQELLAPERLKFYDKSWVPLIPLDAQRNDKPHGNRFTSEPPSPIHLAIEQATGISYEELKFFRPGAQGGDFSKRMKWAAKRVTTRGEDRAYSLMGIFSVSISIAYGEGLERAFFRLIEQIMHSYRNIMDILNWAGVPVSSSIHSTVLLPSKPECYLNSASDLGLQGILQTPAKPMTLTHLGLRMRLMLVDADVHPSDDAESLLRQGMVRLKCKRGLQEEPTVVHLQNVHDRDLFGPFQFTFKFTFGVWTFRQAGKSVSVPGRCAAFLFRIPHVNADYLYEDDEDSDALISDKKEEGEEEEDVGDLESCMVETSQVISFASSSKFRRCDSEKLLAGRGVKLVSVYL